MILDLRTLFDIPGSEKCFSDNIPLTELSWGGQHPFPGDGRVAGTVRNTAGVVELSYTLSYREEAVCDRCTENYGREMLKSFSHILLRETQDEENEQDFIIAEDSQLDLEELVLSDLVLELPSKFLCKEDCAGVCPVCGVNRNVAPCSCDTGERGNRIRITPNRRK